MTQVAAPPAFPCRPSRDLLPRAPPEALPYPILRRLSSTSQRRAAPRSASAVGQAWPPAICVAQFMKDPNHQEKLQELEKVSSYQRSTFIEKGGWDKMPGEEKAGYTVDRACADGLEVLMKK